MLSLYNKSAVTYVILATIKGMDMRVDAYIAKLDSPQREICERLRSLIVSNFPEWEETYKWNVPCYYMGKIRICSLGGFSRHANLEFDYGAHINDPKNRIEGTGINIRHIKIRSLDEIDEEYFLQLLSQSVSYVEKMNTDK